MGWWLVHWLPVWAITIGRCFSTSFMWASWIWNWGTKMVPLSSVWFCAHLSELFLSQTCSHWWLHDAASELPNIIAFDHPEVCCSSYLSWAPSSQLTMALSSVPCSKLEHWCGKVWLLHDCSWCHSQSLQCCLATWLWCHHMAHKNKWKCGLSWPN